MPRAIRYFLPGYIRYITHRCHKKEFLLNLSRENIALCPRFYAKSLIGIMVINEETGEPPMFEQRLVRYIGYYFSSALLALGQPMLRFGCFNAGG